MKTSAKIKGRQFSTADEFLSEVEKHLVSMGLDPAWAKELVELDDPYLQRMFKEKGSVEEAAKEVHITKEEWESLRVKEATESGQQNTTLVAKELSKRKIIQIQALRFGKDLPDGRGKSQDTELIALCDDGSVWTKLTDGDSEWCRVEDIPQDVSVL